MKTQNIILICAVCILWLGIHPDHASVAQGQSQDVEFVTGLRERRLYPMAESYSQHRLKEDNLTITERTDLVLQLIQTQVARALAKPVDERGPIWAEAHRVAREVNEAFPENPRRVVVAMQDALSWVAEGQALREEWELNDQPAVQQAAAETLRRAATELAKVQQAIQEGMVRGRTSEELTPHQWLALSNHAAFQLARCYANTARLFADTDRLNRIDALARVDRQLSDLNGRVPPTDLLWWRIRLLRSECFRLLNDLASADQLWQEAQGQAVPESLIAAWWTEQIHLAIDHQTTSGVIGQMTEIGDLYQNDPELALALIELFLTESNRSQQGTDREAWQQRASQLIQAIQNRFGDYWVRRANLLVAKSLPSADRVANADLILALAGEMVRKGDRDGALSILDLAAQKALQTQALDTVFAISYEAALLQQNRRQYRDAMDRFRLLAAGYPKHARAADAHLRAAWNLAQIVGNDSTALVEYQSLLVEQIENWPQASVTPQAVLWLTPLLVRSGDFEQALKYLGTVPPGEFLAAAIQAARTVCAAWIGRVEESADVDAVADSISRIQSTLADWDQSLQQNSAANSAQRELESLSLMRMQIAVAFQKPDFPVIIARLQAMNPAIDGQPGPQAADIQTTLVLSRAGTGDGASRDRSIQIADLLTLELVLHSWQHLMKDSIQADLSTALLSMKLADQLAVRIRGRDVEQRWLSAMAQARWHSGAVESAVDSFEQLIKDNPHSLVTRREFARLMMTSAKPEHQQAALEQWRWMAEKCRPQSDDWFEAKYYVARLLKESGDAPAARQLLRYIQTVPPGWTKSRWNNALEQLLNECSGGGDDP